MKNTKPLVLNPSKETMKSKMKKTIVAFSIVTLAASSAHAATIFSHTFDGEADDLNGTAVDTGSGTWVAPALYDQNGNFNVTDSTPFNNDNDGRGLATVAFTPVDGFIYTLEASLGGFTGGNDWLGFGFAAATNDAYGARFAVASSGRAWAIVRGSGANQANQSFLVGTGNGLPWENAANAYGGNMDLRMVLDTTAGTGNWNVTMFADTGSGFSQIRAVTTLSDEGIGAVGFSTANETVVGNINSISLTSAIPEPSAALLGGLGMLALLRRRRA